MMLLPGMFGIASRNAGDTEPGGDCAGAISGTITDAVSKADNANIGRVTTCMRMITLLSPVYRQSVREAPYQVKGRSPHAGRGTVRKLFLLDRILSGGAERLQTGSPD